MDQQQRVGDLVLPPSTFAHVLDNTKGIVNVYVGPNKTSLSDNDQLVRWNEGDWTPVHRNDAIQRFVKAEEGQYIVLSDPVRGENAHDFPTIATRAESKELDAGRKIVIPGPISFALWPGQVAEVVDGHHLRNNQYLVVRVYEPAAARENAQAAVIERAGGETKGQKERVNPSDYTMGKLIVIKGTDVSFYIPPTGIEVVPDPSNSEYVRGAVTLQRLEYCILLDENGDKRYVQGPAVVFPKPTEIFVTDDNNKRRFTAEQLNAQSGLYIKVIADYHEGQKNYKAGEERFITGADTPIYFPRPEESIISYGEQRKHHAIAIPKGEGRYVLDRTKGSVDLVTGPKMFLPNPIDQVIIRRILDLDLCAIMYPDNEEALQANRRFAEEGQQLANMLAEERTRGLMSPPTSASLYASVSSSPMGPPPAPSTEALLQSAAAMEDVEAIRARARAQGTGTGKAVRRAHSEGEILRKTDYTPPRTIVLDTKYEGAVRMAIYPGYAIMLVRSTGERRVVRGPQAVLLEYDEVPMTLNLSSGKPKTTDNLVQDVYLRTINNQVSDRITVETKDLVPVTIDISYRVDFEGEPEKWFTLDNYVKVLTDHCRSKLRNLAKRHDYTAFYTDAIDLIREALLGEAPKGKSRPGMTFDENGMHLFEIEVLGVRVNNTEIEKLTRQATYNTLEGEIKLTEAEQHTRQQTRFEELTREGLESADETKRLRHELALETLGRDLTERLKLVSVELSVEKDRQKVTALSRNERKLDHTQEIEFERENTELALQALRGEVEQFIKRTEAIKPDLVKAITVFGDQRLTEALVTSLGPVAAALGLTTGDLMHRTFEGTALEGVLGTITERPFAAALANGGRDE